jgi:hypothetical protein
MFSMVYRCIKKIYRKYKKYTPSYGKLIENCLMFLYIIIESVILNSILLHLNSASF